MTPTGSSAKISRWALTAILILAFGLRVLLVMRGGQDFWTDENRYTAARVAAEALAHHDVYGAIEAVGNSADHLGFKVVMIAPAVLQRLTGWNDWMPALFLSLFSTANIAWVWAIAVRAGAGVRESLWAAAAMACSCSMTYWSRHVMPYDLSLFWALAASFVALKPRPKVSDSFLAGVLGCVAFVTYNGYWLLVACVLTAHVLRAWPNWREGAKRTAAGLAGLFGSFALLVEIDSWTLNINLLQSYSEFSGSIDQGNFNEGHIVFFDYLWRAERFTALIWLGALLAFFWLARRSSADERRRGALWVATIVALAAILIGGSDVLGKFVVYGRLVRQVVPFCALLFGWTAARIFDGSPRPRLRATEIAALSVLLIGAISGLETPLRQEFPVAFHLRAVACAHAYRSAHVATDPRGVAPEKFRFLYNGFIWPYPDEKPLLPGYKVLLASPHPLAWRPYLYEGFNRDQRDRIEATDITMRLVLLKD